MSCVRRADRARRTARTPPTSERADATPLFLVLLDEYHRWTGDDELVRALEPNARAALTGSRPAATATATATSNTSAATHDRPRSTSAGRTAGTRSSAPTDARARADRDLRDPGLRLRRAAALRPARPRGLERPGARARAWSPGGRLRENFRRDFWMPERGCHALALDGDKRQVDSLTSNIGHLLWSGSWTEPRRPRPPSCCSARSSTPAGESARSVPAEAGYNPLGYHTGTVWPHDNSLIVAGLARYGHRDAATTIASAISAPRPTSSIGCPRCSPAFRARADEALTTVPVAFPTWSGRRLAPAGLVGRRAAAAAGAAGAARR
jgi:hypothetical protein